MASADYSSTTPTVSGHRRPGADDVMTVEVVYLITSERGDPVNLVAWLRSPGNRQ